MRSIFAFILLFFNQFSYSSFAPETLVRTRHGFVLISDLQLGQTIVSYDELKHSFVVGAVQDSYSYQTTHAYRVTCDDTSFITTADQRIVLYRLHTWRSVKDLMIGDRLLCCDNSFVTVSIVEPLDDELSLCHVAVVPQPTLLITERGIVAHNHPIAIFAIAPPVISVLSKVAIVGVISGALWSLFGKKKMRDIGQYVQDSSTGCSSPPPPKKPNDEDEFRRKHPHGRYEDVTYHHKNSGGTKSPAPIDGQKALDNSLRIKDAKPHRIGISEDQFVVLRETSPGLFHGYVCEWGQLTDTMQKVLRKAQRVSHNGKIICK